MAQISSIYLFPFKFQLPASSKYLLNQMAIYEKNLQVSLPNCSSNHMVVIILLALAGIPKYCPKIMRPLFILYRHLKYDSIHQYFFLLGTVKTSL